MQIYTECEEKLIPVNLFFTTYAPLLQDYSKSKSPIIFIHGMLSSPYTWNRVKTRICDNTGRTAYAINLRNHGTSGWSNEFTLKHLVADLKNFMMEKNISRAVLIGHSVGGRVAMSLALENPEMVEKLVIEDMNLKDDDSVKGRCEHFLKMLHLAAITLEQCPTTMSETAAQRKIQPLFSSVWCTNSTKKTTLRPVAPILPFHKDQSGKFVWDINIKDISRNFAEHLESFQQDLSNNPVYPGETLFISAEYSNLCLMNDKDLIPKHFPNSKIILINDIFHAYHAEREDEYVEEISDFIGS